MIKNSCCQHNNAYVRSCDFSRSADPPVTPNLRAIKLAGIQTSKLLNSLACLKPYGLCQAAKLVISVALIVQIEKDK
jgi:hypothetical protein